jgi:hypothetical protein
MHLDGWDCLFESLFGLGCSSVMLVVCCVGRGLCDVLIIRSGEFYQVYEGVSDCVCGLVTPKMMLCLPTE